MAIYCWNIIFLLLLGCSPQKEKIDRSTPRSEQTLLSAARYKQKLKAANFKKPRSQPSAKFTTKNEAGSNIATIETSKNDQADFISLKACPTNKSDGCFTKESASGVFRLYDQENGNYNALIRSCVRDRFDQKQIECGPEKAMNFKIKNKISPQLLALLEERQALSRRYQRVVTTSHQAMREYLLERIHHNKKIEALAFNHLAMGQDYWHFILNETQYLTQILESQRHPQILEATQTIAPQLALATESQEKSDNPPFEKNSEPAGEPHTQDDAKPQEQYNEQDFKELMDGLNESQEEKRKQEISDQTKKTIIDSAGMILISMGSPIFITGLGIAFFSMTLSDLQKVGNEYADEAFKSIDQLLDDYAGTAKTTYIRQSWNDWQSTVDSAVRNMEGEEFITSEQASEYRRRSAELKHQTLDLKDGSETPKEIVEQRRAFDLELNKEIFKARSKQVIAYNKSLEEQMPHLKKINTADRIISMIASVQGGKNDTVSKEQLERAFSNLNNKYEAPSPALLKRLELEPDNLDLFIDSLSQREGLTILNPDGDLTRIKDNLLDIRQTELNSLKRISVNLGTQSTKIRTAQNHLKELTKQSFSVDDLGKLNEIITENGDWIANNTKYILGEALVTDIVDTIDLRQRAIAQDAAQLLQKNSASVSFLYTVFGGNTQMNDISKLIQSDTFLLRAEVRNKFGQQITEVNDVLQTSVRKLIREARLEISNQTATGQEALKTSNANIANFRSRMLTTGILTAGLGALIVAAGVAYSVSSELSLTSDPQYQKLIISLQKSEEEFFKIEVEKEKWQRKALQLQLL